MKLIIGIGNIGEEYENNRHNVGYMFLEKLSLAMNAEGWKNNNNLKASLSFRKPLAILVKPLCYMNESGKVIRKIFKYYKLANVADLIVIHDDLDIPLGKYKIDKGHGPRLHKGVNSIEKEFKSEWFVRVRVGIENRNKNNRVPGEKYVLENFTGDELLVLNSVFDRLTTELIKDYLV